MSAYRGGAHAPEAWVSRVTTSDALPGFVVEKLLCVVWGGARADAGRYEPWSGTIDYDARLVAAMSDIAHEAERRGANAVTGLRFVVLGDPPWGRVVAYGNAVWVTPVP